MKAFSFCLATALNILFIPLALAATQIDTPPPQWLVTPSPDTANTTTNVINSKTTGVAVIDGKNDVWSVGYSLISQSLSDSGVSNTLIEHWDGNIWEIASSPNPTPGKHNRLYAVSALSSQDIWAVGETGDVNGGAPLTVPLIAHWVGSWKGNGAWKVVPNPELPANGFSFKLSSVAAVAANDVWAVGSYEIGVGINVYAQQLIVHWNGIRWITTKLPIILTSQELVSVTANSWNDVWAVGYSDNQPFSIHWDGFKWTTIPCPPITAPFTNHARLTKASASANGVWAVGFSVGSAFAPEGHFPILYHYDGQKWSNVQTYDSTAVISLDGVLNVANNDVYIVGQVGPKVYPYSGPIQTLVEHYDGTGWKTLFTPPLQPGQASRFFDIAKTKNGALAENGLWAVGSFFNSTASYPPVFGQHTLIEKYAVPKTPVINK